MRHACRLIVLLFTLSLFVLPVLAQKSAEAEVKYNVNMKSKVFQLQHCSPHVLIPVLQPLTSGRPGALMNYSLEIRTISVRDLQENLDTIEAAIRLLDKPGIVVPRTGLNIQINLIWASQEDVTDKFDMPAAMVPVINQLQKTLNFKSYRHITTINQRTLDQGRVGSSGVTFNYPTSKLNVEKPINYEYLFAGLRVIPGIGESVSIHADEFEFRAFIPTVINPRQVALGSQPPEIDMQKISMTTGLTLREGEQVVVGTSNAGGEGRTFIVVVSISRVDK